jgi:WD40 repeat protein
MSVAFDPTGRRLASGSYDQTVRIWDTATGAELACLHGHENSVSSASFDPTGRRLASGSYDQTVRIWDTATGAELVCLRGHEDLVCSVSFYPTGRCLVSESSGEMRVWDVQSGECLEVLRRSVTLYDIAAEPAEPLAWRALERGLETVIEPAAGGTAVAWFSPALGNLTTHPSGRLWAGWAVSHLYLIRLEGV